MKGQVVASNHDVEKLQRCTWLVDLLFFINPFPSVMLGEFLNWCQLFELRLDLILKRSSAFQ